MWLGCVVCFGDVCLFDLVLVAIVLVWLSLPAGFWFRLGLCAMVLTLLCWCFW